MDTTGTYGAPSDAHRVRAGELLAVCEQALTVNGVPADVAASAAREFVVAELSGHPTHGVGKLVSLDLGDPGAEVDVCRTGAVVRVDGGRGSGFAAMQVACRESLTVARELGVGLAAITNHSRYAGLWPYTSWLAGQGMVAVLANTAGPPAVAPFGGVSPVTGTNPMSVSFPLPGARTHTVDLATAQRVWGEIRQAVLEGRALEHGPFLDASGQVTVEPMEVDAVRAFGGAKGFALNFVLELLAGALVGAPVGSSVTDEYGCGALLVTIDPSATAPGHDLGAAVEALVSEVHAATGEVADQEVRCPGDRAGDKVVLSQRMDTVVQVPSETWAQLVARSEGRRDERFVDPLLN